ncbi:MAG: DUF4136 domain-containing protein [Sphingomonas sp.]
MKKSLILAAAAAALALSGCATGLNTRVSRFQELSAPAGQSFVVQSKDPRLDGSLEFQHYADIVAAHMVQQGYTRAADPAHADLVVDMHYSVDHGREKVVSTPDPWGPGWGPWSPWGGYWGRRGWGWGWNDPFLWGPGYGADVRSYTVYTSELDLSIDRTSDGKQVFEGHAQAHSSTDALTKLVPDLIEAMFTGFPGNSGETVKITVQPERR